MHIWVPRLAFPFSPMVANPSSGIYKCCKNHYIFDHVWILVL